MRTINIIGSGNVGTQLAIALKNSGYEIACIASRDRSHAEKLAQQVGAKCTTTICQMRHADITIIAVSDNSIGEVCNALVANGETGIVVHTSGATPMSALASMPHHGVLYPCMTFTKGDDINLKNCPFLVEAGDGETLNSIKGLASRIGGSVTECDSNGRRSLHLAAVLASNFTNHMLLKAQEVLQTADLPLSILKPLTEQTIDKAFRMSPLEAQTGPARRNDTATIERHRSIINNKHLAKIYEAVTESIIATYSTLTQKRS